MNPALQTLILAFASDQEHFISLPDDALFIGAEPHSFFKQIPKVVGLQVEKHLADAWVRAGFELTTTWEQNHETWSCIVILPTKSRELTLGNIAMAFKHLKPDGYLVIALPNNIGAARYEKELRAIVPLLHSIQKNKCRVFFAKKDSSWNLSLLDDWATLLDLKAVSGSPFISSAGTFSHASIDAGSQFLIEHLPKYIKGQVADFGAGWGFLSYELIQRYPDIENLHLYENNFTALECAQVNLQTHQDKILYHWHDVTTGVIHHYDTIVMNPPFHQGKETSLALGQQFIQVAVQALHAHGTIFLVANKQLPYEKTCQKLNISWKMIAENQTFKVLSLQNHARHMKIFSKKND